MGYNQAFVRMSLKVCENTWETGYILRNGEMGILRITSDTVDNIGQQIYIKIGDGLTEWDKLPIPNNVNNFSDLQNKVSALENAVISLENAVEALQSYHE